MKKLSLFLLMVLMMGLPVNGSLRAEDASGLTAKVQANAGDASKKAEEQARKNKKDAEKAARKAKREAEKAAAKAKKEAEKMAKRQDSKKRKNRFYFMNKYWYLGIGGVAGTFARCALSGFIHRFVRPDFPYGTLRVNLAGCFLVGLFAALSGGKFPLTHNTRLLLVTGFCGAFTTFSALILETGTFLQHGQMVRAAVYLFVSGAAGFLFFRAGVLAGEIF